LERPFILEETVSWHRRACDTLCPAPYIKHKEGRMATDIMKALGSRWILGGGLGLLLLGAPACGTEEPLAPPAEPQEAVAPLAPESAAQPRIPPPQPYCWNLDNTACTYVGSTLSCTDGTFTDYVCTCKQNTATNARSWDCPEVR
jgi:hypothetical protein